VLHKFFLFTVFVFFVGCATGVEITAPLDATLLSEDEATIIVFRDEHWTDECQIIVDGKPMGFVTPEVPLKFTISDGHHRIYTSVPLLIDREIDLAVDAGNVYYMRVYVDWGMWVGSVRFRPALVSFVHDFATNNSP
jgi:hypothetical protein